MSLLEAVRSQFDAAIRTRGSPYFHQGKVHNLQGNEHQVTAEVVGSDEYDVVIRRDKHSLVVRCDCPFFQDRLDPCKHVWAVLLAASEKNYLNGNGSTRRKLTVIAGDDDDGFDEDDDWDDEDDEEPWEEPSSVPIVTQPPRQRRQKAKAPAPPVWEKQLKALSGALASSSSYSVQNPWTFQRQIWYVIEAGDTAHGQTLWLSVPHRERKANGEWSKLKIENIQAKHVPHLGDPDDRNILGILFGTLSGHDDYGSYDYRSAHDFHLRDSLAEMLVPLLCRTGRCGLRRGLDDEPTPLAWDDQSHWTFALKWELTQDGKSYQVSGILKNGEEIAPLSQPALVKPGLVFWQDRAAPLKAKGDFRWVEQFRRVPELTFPVEQRGPWLQQFFRLPDLPRLELPADLQVKHEQGTARPRLLIHPPRDAWRAKQRYVEGHLSFEYGGQLAAQPGPLFDPETNTLIQRDVPAETAARRRLSEAGFIERMQYGQPPRLELHVRHLPKVVPQLVTEGWRVEAEGKLYRTAGKIDIEVKSGIDWFELHGKVDFDGTQVALPELLQALKKGDKTVVLDDGSLGMLPEDWLKKYGLLAGLGKADDGHLKFGRNQAGLLDALLAAQPEAQCDAAFSKIRAELRRFEGVQPADPEPGFQGELRGYQRDGLGWLHFLHRFGFGGCLADDMGLGKTVQVLAMLDARRRQDKSGPSLVVVPKSLVFNWKQESARFTPDLKVLDHTGIDRIKPGEHFKNYDLILTTYGTLRRDALELKDCRFDYCILDEAQAVKNAKSESAKACRLIQADHRLAVTGTPVENHLGELWSLFDFLNPGMLGQASVFQLAGAGARNPEPETRELLARALRPFMLRRTKEQVAKDLPAKTEQTIYAEMEPAQRKLYNELRDHFRLSLLNKVQKDGIARSTFQILEALLRLRQAACHPGLIDKSKIDEPSAKLDMLMPQLSEVVEEGHKSLVFSQFTSMLAIVRRRLDHEGIVYEYLDGSTRDRAARVERFQTDPDCKLFLISLKAGGVGLNLTAAEYVYLLDPWWNPAVEAQAIDRTHRIGQSNPVFAYRLIVKDTVEEKVLELQSKKRALADAILNTDNSLIRDLGKEDLELLLS